MSHGDVTEGSAIQEAVQDAGLGQYLEVGYEFFYDGQVLKFTADWETFYDAPDHGTAPPSPGTYPTWSDRGAGVSFYGVPKPPVPSVSQVAGSGPPASSRPPASSSSSGSSSSGPSRSYAASPPKPLPLDEAVKQAGLQAKAAEGCQFFYDGRVLKYTDNWKDFYDKDGDSAGPPAAGTIPYWSQDEGYTHADFDLGEPQEVEDESVDDLMGAFAKGSDLAKELDKKAKEDDKAKPPVITTDQDGYVLADGKKVMVNGCEVFWRGDGTLWAINQTSLRQFQVMNGTGTVTSTAGLTFERGVAKISADPLSLDARWRFQWNVVIADAEKYADAAYAAFESLTSLEYHQNQCYTDVGTVNGYTAHVSVDSRDVRAGIKSAILAGRQPAVGFLASARFHLTVEVNGQVSQNNPHVFDNSTGWAGPTSALGGTSPATAIKLARYWLGKNR